MTFVSAKEAKKRNKENARQEQEARNDYTSNLACCDKMDLVNFCLC